MVLFRLRHDLLWIDILGVFDCFYTRWSKQLEENGPDGVSDVLRIPLHVLKPKLPAWNEQRYDVVMRAVLGYYIFTIDDVWTDNDE